MKCRKKQFTVGDNVFVRHCLGGYRLPGELSDGDSVKVLQIEPSEVFVEFRGKPYRVSPACVDSGWEYKFQGLWHDETNPLIVSARRKPTRRPGIASKRLDEATRRNRWAG